ncbi:Iron-sulfur cluster assembly protein [uncultured archaeon]|nr:Iron-sulfur cluster assembly protein [uncultured archaeon]
MAVVTVKEVVVALKGAVDPEAGISIVDMGLVYGVRVDSRRNVLVTMTMTSPMCPVASMMLADVQLRIARIPGVAAAKIDLVWEPSWSPAMMTEELRAQMGV